jgi:murein L,D-transpeptidase YcbB/YkuD
MAVYFAGKSPEEFGEAIASGKTTKFSFDDPFPVYVAYWTVVPGAKGGVTKLADIYGRDAPVVASFAKPGRAAAVVISPNPPVVVPTAPVTAAPQPGKLGDSGIY